MNHGLYEVVPGVYQVRGFDLANMTLIEGDTGVIVFDTLYRLLRHLYGEAHVRYVRNITDVDDKINARAASEHPDLPLNEAIARVTAGTTRQFHADIAALGALPPDVEPRATKYVGEMIALIERLVARNGQVQVTTSGNPASVIHRTTWVRSIAAR